ncbi:hypothetical protein [Trinickia terrae]|uniref:hypothetical protein n=1 Tax=Trinickia terrae TaxID=2571161 RepID=UPI001F106446|nr:hypothetical protein [Trinickia terrae]
MIVELDDPVMGGNKLGLVDESGVGYFDLLDDGEIPKPIQAEFNPRSLGPIETWIGGVPPERREWWVQAWRELSRRRLDILTLARALRWGLDNQSVDIDLIEQMGREASQRIQAGRKQIAQAFSGGGR